MKIVTYVNLFFNDIFKNVLKVNFLTTYEHSVFVTKRLSTLAVIQWHSALIMNVIKLKGTAKLIAQGERVCLKDSKYVSFEILKIGHGRAVKAPASRASQIAKSGLLGRHEHARPFHVLCLESLRHTRSPCVTTG